MPKLGSLESVCLCRRPPRTPDRNRKLLRQAAATVLREISCELVRRAGFRRQGPDPSDFWKTDLSLPAGNATPREKALESVADIGPVLSHGRPGLRRFPLHRLWAPAAAGTTAAPSLPGTPPMLCACPGTRVPSSSRGGTVASRGDPVRAPRTIQSGASRHPSDQPRTTRTLRMPPSSLSRSGPTPESGVAPSTSTLET